MTRLFVVTGAPGAGKSTVIPELLRLRSGHPVPRTGGSVGDTDALVVMDMDELLDDEGCVLGIEIADTSAAANWPAYNALWRRVTELVRRSGTPVLLLCPLVPQQLPEGRWLHLDCPDPVRRKRLAKRGWSEQQIASALEDAAELRKLVPRSVPGTSTPEDAAHQILAWVNE